MSLESQVADLVTATTAMTSSVNARMDEVVAIAKAKAVDGKTITNSTLDACPIGQSIPAPVTASSVNVNNGGTINAAGGEGTCPQITCVSSPMGRIGLYANSTPGTVVGVPSGTVGLATLEPVPIVFATRGLERMRLDAGGNLLLGVSSGNCHSIFRPSEEGAIIAQIYGKESVVSAEFRVVSGLGMSAAPAGVLMGKNSATGRSLNAGGTINASGADYAEYESKSAKCGPVLAGQIIGFDADGRLTDQFNQAVSFAIKSTNPSIVGGDSWGDESIIGAKPKEPDAPDLPVLWPEPQSPVPDQFDGDLDAYHAAITTYHADHTAWLSWQTEYARLLAAADLEQAKAMQDYETELAVWDAKLEAARANVDRIAYCGKVPVLLAGAKLGDYLLPVAKGTGISGRWIAAADIDLVPGDYRRAIGQVRKVLKDGTAIVVVKPI